MGLPGVGMGCRISVRDADTDLGLEGWKDPWFSPYVSTDVGEEIQDLESSFLTDLSIDQEKIACRTLTASLALLLKKKKIQTIF